MFLIKISVALVLVAATIAAVLALPVPGNTLSTGEEHLDGHNPLDLVNKQSDSNSMFS